MSDTQMNGQNEVQVKNELHCQHMIVVKLEIKHATGNKNERQVQEEQDHYFKRLCKKEYRPLVVLLFCPPKTPMLRFRGTRLGHTMLFKTTKGPTPHLNTNV